jgi:excisionase family DNA binding protein
MTDTDASQTAKNTARTYIEARLIGIAEVAAMIGVSQGRIRHLVRIGALPAVRLGGTGYHRFRREDVEALIRGGDEDSEVPEACGLCKTQTVTTLTLEDAKP